MLVRHCPRCQEPYSQTSAAQEWVQCSKCRHRWMVAGSEQLTQKPVPEILQPVPLPVPAVVPVLPVVVPIVPLPVLPGSRPPAAIKPLQRMDSDEYVPIETREMSDLTKPLTSRRGNALPASESVPGDAPAATPVPVKSPAPRASGRAKIPVGGSSSALHQNSASDPFDPGLFDRAEREARMARARQPTMVEVSIKSDVEAQAPLCCPACGHLFASLGVNGERSACPSCRSSFVIEPINRVQSSSVGIDQLIGRNLRGCLIDRKIGEGGMGSVYHAMQLSLERSVAVKVLPPDLARNRNFIARFEREAKNLARINHPNILHIYDFGEERDPGIYFMVIEFVEGKDLGEILHQERHLSSLKVLDVIRQASLGLEMAWEKNVIHRDIKPDNLMLTGEGIWKVMDFGLAKASDDDRDVTTVGVRVGTPAFMSPEQCDGIEVDFRSDIYSLGCTAFLALTGRLPFDGETPFAIMLKHKNDPIPSVRQYRAEIPDVVDRLVNRMLAKKPDERFKSLRELIELVEELEVRAAGTTSILRKTRGPFRALPAVPVVDAAAAAAAAAAAVAVVDIDGGSGPHACQTSGRPASSASHLLRSPSATPLQIPDYLKPVEPPRPKSSGEIASPVPRPPLPRTSSSERIKLSLARVRNRTQQDEASALVAEAQRCEETGRYADAADAWWRAAQLAPDLATLGRFKEHAKSARRRNLLSRSIKILVGLAVTSMIAIVGLWFATPRVHDLFAARGFAELQIIQMQNPELRRISLERFIEDQCRPYAWYESLFRTTYRLNAAAKARDAINQLNVSPERPLPSPVPLAIPEKLTGSSEAESLEQLVRHPTTPWSVIARRAEAALGESQGEVRQRIQAVLDTARRAMAIAAVDQNAIAAAWSGGRHAETVALMESFYAKHPRGIERIPRLQAGRVEVVDADSGRVLTEAKVDIQVAEATPVTPATPVTLATDGVFSRPVNARITLTAVAPGYALARVTVSGPDEVTPLLIPLRLATVWQGRKVSSSLPWARLRAIDQHRVLVLGPEALALVRLDDGEIVARLERRQMAPAPNAEIGLPEWNEALENRGDRVVVTSADGHAATVNATDLSGVQSIYRSQRPVLSWNEKELFLQPGRKMVVTLEATERDLVIQASVGGIARWSRNSPRNRRLPLLWTHEDQVAVIDDQGLRVLDEQEGRELGSYTFAGQRTSPPVLLEQGHIVAVATSNGLVMIRLPAVGSGVITTIQDPLSGEAVSCRLAGQGSNLLVARSDRSLHLLAWKNQALGRTWKQSIPGESGEIQELALAGEYAMVVDTSGVIYLFALADGKLLRRIPTGSPLACPPLLCGDRLLLADRTGRLTLYNVPRAQ